MLIPFIVVVSLLVVADIIAIVLAKKGLKAQDESSKQFAQGGGGQKL